jgi:ribosomal-protein-alanine N-acetyltransferase
VHPEYRRRGIARRLLAETLIAMSEKGARSATLEVRRSNLAAQDLYRKFGFKVVGLRPRYYRDNNEDALLMTLENIDREILQRLV